MSTPTTYNRKEDRRIFLASNPVLPGVMTLCAQIARRTFDGEGRTLAIRILRALLAATTDLSPPEDAPRPHLAVYGRIRMQILATLLGIQLSEARGVWRNALTMAAQEALERILSHDPTVVTPSGRVADLAILVGGCGWTREGRIV